MEKSQSFQLVNSFFSSMLIFLAIKRRIILLHPVLGLVVYGIRVLSDARDVEQRKSTRPCACSCARSSSAALTAAVAADPLDPHVSTGALTLRPAALRGGSLVPSSFSALIRQ
jgi:hypothetical protein